MKFDETYTTTDKLFEILFGILFFITAPIVLAIFGIPLLIIHLRERKKIQKTKRGYGN